MHPSPWFFYLFSRDICSSSHRNHDLDPGLEKSWENLETSSRKSLSGQLYLRIVEGKLNSTPDLIGGLRVLFFLSEIDSKPSWKESTEYSRGAPNPKVRILLAKQLFWLLVSISVNLSALSYVEKRLWRWVWTLFGYLPVSKFSFCSFVPLQTTVYPHQSNVKLPEEFIFVVFEWVQCHLTGISHVVVHTRSGMKISFSQCQQRIFRLSTLLFLYVSARF